MLRNSSTRYQVVYATLMEEAQNLIIRGRTRILQMNLRLSHA